MNTRNTTKHVEKKLQRAIEFLELLQHPRTSVILEYIQENRQADFTELLIRFPEGNIQEDLHNLVESKILILLDSEYQPVFKINRDKLERVFRATTPAFKVANMVN